jgi:putative ABC transport system substrate-binding protein
MRRRDFIAGLGGAVAMPLAARAQQRLRRIGILFGGAEDDPEMQSRSNVIRDELQRLGWTEGRNVQIDIRFGGGDARAVRNMGVDLAATAPDVLVAGGGNPTLDGLKQATATIPIVFAGVVDPVSAGYVAGLARPGSNITGFTPFEYGISAKWLELLKQIDPRVKHVGVLRDPSNPTGIGLLAAMQSLAPSFAVELLPLTIQQAADIENTIEGFARRSDSGLVVTVSGSIIRHRALVIEQALSTDCPLSIPTHSLRPAAVSCPMGPIGSNLTGASPVTWIASSGVKSPRICPYKRRRNTSWSSTSRPRRRSASRCRPRCSPAPTR